MLKGAEPKTALKITSETSYPNYIMQKVDGSLPLSSGHVRLLFLEIIISVAV
jgi:hypothetical protein